MRESIKETQRKTLEGGFPEPQLLHIFAKWCPVGESHQPLAMPRLS